LKSAFQINRELIYDDVSLKNEAGEMVKKTFLMAENKSSNDRGQKI